MLYGIFGLPGSGKSYIVVKNFILERIVDGTVVSNIKLNDEVELENYVYLEKENVDNLHSNIKRIIENNETSHDDKKVLLNHLISLYSSNNGDVTIIIDEAHLYGYRGRSTNISWADDWVSIHRHVLGENKLDLVLVTQIPSRLNTEIAGQIEVAIQAIPSSQRVSTSLMEYSFYGSVVALKSQNKDMRMKRLVTRGKQEIFDIYQSGFVQLGSGDFRKKLYVIIAGLVIGVFYVFNSFNGLVGGNKDISEKVKKVSLDKKVSNIKNNDFNKTVEKINLYADGSEYKIFCRSVPLSFNYSKVDYFYIIKKDDSYDICYKKFRS